jgi:hypothetical protein
VADITTTLSGEAVSVQEQQPSGEESYEFTLLTDDGSIECEAPAPLASRVWMVCTEGDLIEVSGEFVDDVFHLRGIAFVEFRYRLRLNDAGEVVPESL